MRQHVHSGSKAEIGHVGSVRPLVTQNGHWSVSAKIDRLLNELLAQHQFTHENRDHGLRSGLNRTNL